MIYMENSALNFASRRIELNCDLQNNRERSKRLSVSTKKSRGLVAYSIYPSDFSYCTIGKYWKADHES